MARALRVHRAEIAALHGRLKLFVSKQRLQLLEVHHVLVVVEGGVVLHCLVVQRNQVLGGLALPRLLKLPLVFPDGCQQSVDLEVLDRVAAHLALQQQPLLFKFLLDLDTLTLEVLDDERNAFVGVLVHQDLEDPGLTALNAAELHLDLVVGGEAVVDALNGGQRSPGQELGHVLDLGVRLEHNQHVLRDHQVDVDHRLTLLLLDLSFFVLDFDEHLLLLLAWEHAAEAVREPQQHIVVEAEVEPPDHVLAFPSFNHGLLDEVRDLLDQLV